MNTLYKRKLSDRGITTREVYPTGNDNPHLEVIIPHGWKAHSPSESSEHYKARVIAEVVSDLVKAL